MSATALRDLRARRHAVADRMAKARGHRQKAARLLIVGMRRLSKQHLAAAIALEHAATAELTDPECMA